MEDRACKSTCNSPTSGHMVARDTFAKRFGFASCCQWWETHSSVIWSTSSLMQCTQGFSLGEFTRRGLSWCLLFRPSNAIDGFVPSRHVLGKPSSPCAC